jgi:hypothetical protein
MKYTLLVLFALPCLALAQAPAAPAAAPAAPAAAPAAAPEKEPDVQMSDEDIAKAKKEEQELLKKKAAEDAAAERKAQKEAQMAKCVIKMVMTDEEIELCRIAYRD